MTALVYTKARVDALLADLLDGEVTDRNNAIQAAVDDLVASAPGAMNTLRELADALGDDSNYAATMTAALALKAPLDSPAFTGTPTGLTKAHVGLPLVDNTSDAGKPISTLTQAALDAKVGTTDSRLSNARTPVAHAASHGSAGADPVTVTQAQVTGLAATLTAKADLVSGLIPTAQIPALAISQVFPAANQAAMLALSTATVGDIALRADTGVRYILAGTPYSTLANWILLDSGGGGSVSSVNGQAGTVVLAAGDVGAPPTSRSVTAGTGLTGGGDLSADRTLAVAYGTTGGTAAQGNDARLSDTRTPTDGTVTDAKVASGAAIALSKLATNPLARANHTGTQAVGTITGLATIATSGLASDLSGALGLAAMPATITLTVQKTGSTWPDRPTSRSDVMVIWKGPGADPATVSSGTGGMRDNVDVRMVTG